MAEVGEAIRFTFSIKHLSQITFSPDCPRRS
jgi:hypothetical protein